jgi:hypothetical protein
MTILAEPCNDSTSRTNKGFGENLAIKVPGRIRKCRTGGRQKINSKSRSGAKNVHGGHPAGQKTFGFRSVNDRETEDFVGQARGQRLNERRRLNEKQG